jgi:predicted ArsR family transcriptional regulator
VGTDCALCQAIIGVRTGVRDGRLEPVTDADARAADEPLDRLGALGALAEPHRRALYDHVVAVGDWVGRDQAADAVGLERGTAAHHLDRLAADGLLDVDYRRLSGRSGPGAGRPAKVYRRSRRELEVSLPPRDYELAGTMLAEAADRSRTDGTGIEQALDDVARAHGRRLGDEMRQRLAATGRDRGQATARHRAVVDVLDRHGFEPDDRDGTIVLRNCPFHRLAQEHRELICGMNLCLVGAAVARVDDADLVARLEPTDDLCCVRLHRAP